MIPQTTDLSQIQAAFIDKDNRIEELMRQINSANNLVGDGKITIQTYGGSSVGDFTVNQKEDKTITLPQQATVNDGTLTIQRNGTTVGTFTANQYGDTTANISVPTKTSDITNDSGFVTSSDLPVVNDGTLTIQKNGTQVTTFTANQDGDATANITVPTATSELTNDSNYISDVNYVHTDNNFTSADKTKLDGIESGAEVNVQSNWNEINASADSYIRNKPTLALVATSGSYTDLSNKPTIPAAQVNSDWNASSGVAHILNKPTIPTAVSQLTNDSGFITSASVPTATSQLTNDSGYLTASTLPSMRFTYIVDDDTKLSNWANNVAGNDYTRVLIRGQISASNIHINLTNTGTKVIVGEKGSKLTLSISNAGNIFEYTGVPRWNISSGGDMSTTLPSVLAQTSDEYYIQGLSIEVTFSGTREQAVFANCVNIYNTSVVVNTNANEKWCFRRSMGLYNCYAKFSATSNAYNTAIHDCTNIFNTIAITISSGYGRAWAFETCDSLFGCYAVAKGNGDVRGFVTSSRLAHCYGSGQVLSSSSATGYGFYSCTGVSHCAPLTHCHTAAFSNCYASISANSTYAVADTANGGFNNTTNP